ncbi:hypothetical protein EB796_018989 [Bugula neritina]|uniref:TMEM14C n=1 Tax=Bugula neritina TaxID=10212 RepID=A0A7J7J9M0_BUGNE|nr:hypothetical protein EB796_018989 [Bugula neritina]
MDKLHVAYALAIAAGGLAGYIKAGSIPSLAAGVSFGVVVLVGTYLVSIQQPLGQILVIGTAVALTFVMGKRFMNSGKVMPAGVVTLLSVLVLLRFAYVKLVSSTSSSLSSNLSSQNQNESSVHICINLRIALLL